MFFNTLAELLAHGNIGTTDYDLLLIGDGSGSTWERPAGWACVSMDRRAGTRHMLAGGASAGSVGWAELEPYLCAIRHDFYVRQQGELKQARRVVIFSDSQSTVRIGNREYVPKANLDLWGAIAFWEQRGYSFKWVWIDRNTNLLHVLIDRCSKTGELYGELCDDSELYGLLPG